MRTTLTRGARPRRRRGGRRRDRGAQPRPPEFRRPHAGRAAPAQRTAPRKPRAHQTRCGRCGAHARDLCARRPRVGPAHGRRHGHPRSGRWWQAYALAELITRRAQPACGVGWNTLAGLGEIESDHGTSRRGTPRRRRLPRARDPWSRARWETGGRDPRHRRRTLGRGHPLGPRRHPLQFIPDTWRAGRRREPRRRRRSEPIDDAALAAARYLCASGPLDTPARWRAASSATTTSTRMSTVRRGRSEPHASLPPQTRVRSAARTARGGSRRRPRRTASRSRARSRRG